MTTRPQRLVVASANRDKAAEIREILDELLPGVELLDRPAAIPEVEETGETFLDNARLKAVAICEATGLAAIADDSGLEVPALGGAPGIYSARYAGEAATYADNVARLLGALSGGAERSASFVSVVCVAFPDASELVAEGVVAGLIAPAPRGGSGFGYDPVFVPEGAGGRTFAELGASEKAAISHRGRALRAMASQLAALASE